MHYKGFPLLAFFDIPHLALPFTCVFVLKHLGISFLREHLSCWAVIVKFPMLLQLMWLPPECFKL